MNATHALDATTDETANLLDPRRQAELTEFTLWLNAGHLTVAEAAAATGRSQYEIRDAISRGDLPARSMLVVSMEDLSNL